MPLQRRLSAKMPHHLCRTRSQLAAAVTAAEEAVADPVQSEKQHIQQLLNRCCTNTPAFGVPAK